MAVYSSTYLSSIADTSSKGKDSWDKTTSDITNADEENFSNARDIGHLRLNTYRLNVVSSLSKNDTADTYSFNAISTGKLNFSITETSGEDEGGPLDIDISDYLSAAGINEDDYVTNQEDTATSTRATNYIEGGPLTLDLNEYLYNAGIEIEEEDSTTSEAESISEDIKESVEKALNLSTVRVQLYGYERNEYTLLADSGADEDSDLYQAYKDMATGEYEINTKGTYYVKVTRPDDADVTDTASYVMQFQMGDAESYKDDYLTTEGSMDSKEITGEAQLTSYTTYTTTAANSSADYITTMLLENSLSYGDDDDTPVMFQSLQTIYDSSNSLINTNYGLA